MYLLILGQRGGTNIGESFYQAAISQGLDVRILDTYAASEGPVWLKRIFWHLLDKRPLYISKFEKKVLAACKENPPKFLVSTGLSPLRKECLSEIKRISPQTTLINYLTDDPWNRAHSCNWFLRALVMYDHVFNPRKANIDQLKKHGCKNVHFLPFGYDQTLFFPQGSENDTHYQSDVLFIGCADSDRISYVEEIAKQSLKFKLYGNYWKKNTITQKVCLGYADIPTMRQAIFAAKIVLCLVRRANRDGNSMRSFEVPAVGACMLMEDTEEHREIFGDEGVNVFYFSTKQEMLNQIHRLLNDDKLRARLKESSHQLIVRGEHTYADRLKQMLEKSL